MKVYSIGYEGARIEDVCDELVAAGVRRLVDVRDRAWSHRPEFRRSALKAALADRGIEYVHCREAGNPMRPKGRDAAAAAECRAAFVHYLERSPGALDALEGALADTVAATFCYESHRTQCHRGVLFEKLKERVDDLDVVDLSPAVRRQASLFGPT